MSNLLEQAISADDADRAAKLIQHALGIESDDVVHYALRASITGEWLQTEARFLAE